jgi:antitoxin MazE
MALFVYILYIQTDMTGGLMVTTIQRWGNSLGVRIPKPFAVQAALTENSEVDISVEDGRIVLSPAVKEWKLDDLLARITPRNAHSEISWGDKAGAEAW